MVTELSEALGYGWGHFRPAQTSRGWRPPVSGPMGKGWVDLMLVHPTHKRVIFAELKTDRGKLTPEQEWVGEQLKAAGAEHYVWRPRDWDEIVKVLNRRDV